VLRSFHTSGVIIEKAANVGLLENVPGDKSPRKRFQQGPNHPPRFRVPGRQPPDLISALPGFEALLGRGEDAM